MSADEVLVIYDGDCPVCNHFVRGARLHKASRGLRLVSAREDVPEVHAALAAGFDFDDGMLVRIGARYYFGADAAHMLVLLSTPYGLFNRLLFLVLRSPGRARAAYPLLRAGRNLLLRLLGRKRVSALPR